MAGLEAYSRAGGEADIEIYKTVLEETFGDGTAWQERMLDIFEILAIGYNVCKLQGFVERS